MYDFQTKNKKFLNLEQIVIDRNFIQFKWKLKDIPYIKKWWLTILTDFEKC